MSKTYTIKTKSKMLAEFAQTPEGMAKTILVVTLPFWGISLIAKRLSEWIEK